MFVKSMRKLRVLHLLVVVAVVISPQAFADG